MTEPTDFDTAWAELVVAVQRSGLWSGLERLAGWLDRQRWVHWMAERTPAWWTPWGWRYWQWWVVLTSTLAGSVLIGLAIRAATR